MRPAMHATTFAAPSILSIFINVIVTHVVVIHIVMFGCGACAKAVAFANALIPVVGLGTNSPTFSDVTVATHCCCRRRRAVMILQYNEVSFASESYTRLRSCLTLPSMPAWFGRDWLGEADCVSEIQRFRLENKICDRYRVAICLASTTEFRAQKCYGNAAVSRKCAIVPLVQRKGTEASGLPNATPAEIPKFYIYVYIIYIYIYITDV